MKNAKRFRIASCVHCAVMAGEVLVLMCVTFFGFSGSIPLANRCYTQERQTLAIRIAKTDQDLSCLKTIRVDYTTRQKPEEDRHADQMIATPVDHNTVYARHQVEIPPGVFAIGVSFHFSDGRRVLHDWPRLAELSLDDADLMARGLEPFRNVPYNFPAWYYRPHPVLKGYWPEFVFVYGAVCLLLVGAFVVNGRHRDEN